jgi:toxin ParE1/3/4
VKILWTSEAQQDRADVSDTIATEKPHAATTVDESFSDAAIRWADGHHTGR